MPHPAHKGLVDIYNIKKKEYLQLESGFYMPVSLFSFIFFFVFDVFDVLTFFEQRET